jgi:hypothetical protein
MLAIARFWDKVEKTDGCWFWRPSKTARDYGGVTFLGKDKHAHVISYELVNGPVPKGLVVMHDCDNPSCVNPAHLKAGTLAENLQDAWKRGLTTPQRGERNGMAKLSWATVREIRRRYKDNKPSMYALATEYGVSQSTIIRVIHGEAWNETA